MNTTATGALSGVWGTAPDNVYIVGGSDAGGEIHHFDGTAWSPMDVPDGRDSRRADSNRFKSTSLASELPEVRSLSGPRLPVELW